MNKLQKIGIGGILASFLVIILDFFLLGSNSADSPAGRLMLQIFAISIVAILVFMLVFAAGRMKAE